ncbi:unnamed protein product [Lepidochelys kempii]
MKSMAVECCIIPCSFSQTHSKLESQGSYLPRKTREFLVPLIDRPCSASCSCARKGEHMGSFSHSLHPCAGLSHKPCHCGLLRIRTVASSGSHGISHTEGGWVETGPLLCSGHQR